MLCTGCICCDKRNVDVSRCCGGQLDLCLFCSILQTLYCHLVSRQVNALGLFELLDHPVDDTLVEVVAAQTVVAGSSQYLLYTVAHLNDGDIECTAAQVIYHNSLVVFLIDTVRKCSSSRLVDDTLYRQTCDLSCILGCLTLRVGEVCRNGDNCLCYRLTQICFCICFQLLEDHCGDLLRCILLAVDIHFIVRTHVTLDRRNRALRVCDCLTLCSLTNQTLAGLREAHNRRSRSCALGVGDYDCVAAFHNGNTRVCCTQVNTNNLSHSKSSFLYLRFPWRKRADFSK